MSNARDYSVLPLEIFGSPGSGRDHLVAAILSGVKTATASLHAEYEFTGEPLPSVGGEGVVIDSQDRPVAVIRTTAVKVCRLGDVDAEHATAEGTSLEEWRRDHKGFFSTPYFAELFGAPFEPDEETLVILQRFELVEVVRDRA